MDSIVLLFGGASSERRVSVASAQHMLERLPRARALFESPAGQIFEVAAAELQAHERPFETEFVPRSPPRFASLGAALDASMANDPRAVHLLGYHGGAGEDGTVQRLLEERGLAFTGSGSLASAKAFDKTWAKRLASAAGVPCAAERLLPRGDAQGCMRLLSELVQQFGRAVAKPVAGGSSVGLYHVASPADVVAAGNAIAAAPEAYLAEEFLEGRELTVGVVEGPGGTVRALPCSEVRLDAGHAFDYAGKYRGRGTTEITPAQLEPELARAAQALAITAHQALGCEGYTRTDQIITPRGPVYLETNTLPGLTKRSFIPQQLEAEGTSVVAFLEGQLALARARQARRG
jgi:D-alanine-D-alanine ligase